MTRHECLPRTGTRGHLQPRPPGATEDSLHPNEGGQGGNDVVMKNEGRKPQTLHTTILQHCKKIKPESTPPDLPCPHRAGLPGVLGAGDAAPSCAAE